MNLTLKRDKATGLGIFSTLSAKEGSFVLKTLEHAYQDKGKWVPKIPNGVFTCVRGPHRLAGMTHDFETFEITGVPEHSSILFHCGNWNRDSEGCVLLGKAENGVMIIDSRLAFEEFMALQQGIDSFQLIVLG